MLSCLILSLSLMGQDKTLRIDYIFSGTDKVQEISLDEMSSFDGWAGRRVNMDEVPVRGNGQIAKDANVTELWLTHYSPSLTWPEEFIGKVRKIFPNAIAAKDGRSVDLCFEE